MKFHNFLDGLKIHIIDYSGPITMEKGLSRMAQMEKKFRAYRSNGATLKVLYDARHTIWESMETHDALAKIARQKFNSDQENSQMYVAILNNQYSAPISKNEHWFTDKKEALNWLIEQKV